MMKKKYNRGFTLIEVMIAVSILVLVLIGLIKVEAYNIRLASLSKHKVQATNLAQSEINLVKTVRDNSIADPFAKFIVDPAIPNQLWKLSPDLLVAHTWKLEQITGAVGFPQEVDGTNYNVKIYIKPAINTYSIPPTSPSRDAIQSRIIEVVVTWEERGTQTITLDTVLRTTP